MVETDYLFTLAEVAVAFVGFSAIVAALRQSGKGQNEREQDYMRSLVERSLAVVGFSMLPELLANLVFTVEQAVSYASGMLGVYILLVGARSVVYHSKHRMSIALGSFWVRMLVSALIAFSQLANAFSFNGGYLLGTYMMGCSFLLIAAGLSFVAMLQISPVEAFHEDNLDFNCWGKKIRDKAKK